MCDVRWSYRRRGGRGRLVRPVLALAVGLMLMLAVAPVNSSALAAQPPGAMQESTPEDVVRAWVAAVNQGDPDSAVALYAEDAVIEALGQQIRGKAAIARRQRIIIAPVLRPQVEIEQLTVAGEAATARFVGENALTRFDGRGPVHAMTTFYVQGGLIRREVGPVLDPADAAWYADTMPRFRATGALPQLLPNAGDLVRSYWPVGVLALLLGATLIGAGIVLVRRSRAARRQHGVHSSGDH